jgi:predicted  nucleic acid-binding Zn-ribbon protein
MALSPAKAASIAGVSRTMISRALTSGDLVGVKKNSGHWAIEHSDLLDWMERTITRAESKPATPAPTPDQIEMEALQTELKAAIAAGQEARERLAAANARLAALDEMVSALKAERDAWQRQAKTLASRPAGILAKLFGR